MAQHLHKLNYYLDFLNLHKEARKDKIVIRDRKMLDDSCASDTRKGYIPSVDRLFRDCLKNLFKEDEFVVEKLKYDPHSFTINYSDRLKNIAVHYAIARHKVTGSFFGSDIVASLVPLLGRDDNHRNFINSFNQVQIENSRANTAPQKCLLKVQGKKSDGKPDTYGAFLELKKIKPIVDQIIPLRLAKLTDPNTFNFGERLRSLAQRIQVANNIVLLREPGEAVTQEFTVGTQRLERLMPSNDSAVVTVHDQLSDRVQVLEDFLTTYSDGSSIRLDGEPTRIVATPFNYPNVFENLEQIISGNLDIDNLFPADRVVIETPRVEPQFTREEIDQKRQELFGNEPPNMRPDTGSQYRFAEATLRRERNASTTNSSSYSTRPSDRQNPAIGLDLAEYLRTTGR